ncbi:MAG: tripartite tricarboxylate transporter substrate binding protein [Xanthobacteraceae bacterium]
MRGDRTTLCAAAFFLALLSIGLQCASANAQDYPTRPIHIIVPTQPGGLSDVVSRFFAQRLGETAKATAVVENKSGANGVIAANYVAKSEPDGYTVYLGFQGTQSVLQHLDPHLPYDPATDFAPVVLIATAPSVLVVNPAFPAMTVSELVALAKKKPGSLSYASAGFGTTAHLVAEQFKLAAGIDIVGVTYRGAAPADEDVIAGNVPMTFDNLGNAMNNIHGGLVRPLAVTSRQRSPLLPDVPTMAEAGFPGVQADAWFAFFVPAKTPPEAIEWLNARANEIFSAPDARARFAALGVTLPLGSPQVLGTFVDSETKRWGEVIRKANIKLP